jgi:predicted nucleotidyltransferase
MCYMFKKMNLFSKTEMKILFSILDGMESEIYEREISRKVGVSIGAVNQALKAFTELKILGVKKKGRMNLYTANMWNPLVRQLKVLFNVMKIYDFLGEMREKTQKIVLFGSASEGMNTRKSDIDLFVITKHKDKVLTSVRRLEAELDTRIDAVIAEPDRIADFKRENKELYEQISCGIKLWDENELRV